MNGMDNKKIAKKEIQKRFDFSFPVLMAFLSF